MVLAPEKPAAAVETGALPPRLVSVVDVSGDISVARVRGTSESRLADYLTGQGIDWYNPRELVRKRYIDAETGKARVKTYTRAFIPGILFVGGGYDGRYAAADYGKRFRHSFYNFIGLPGTAASRRLLAELVRIERMLFVDPTLSSQSGVRKGDRVRVVAGHKFEGLEGVVDRSGPVGTMYVNLPILGASTEVQIDPADLEPAD